MSMHHPSNIGTLPYPLHRIHLGPGKLHQQRIIYKEQGEWMLWKAFSTELKRDAWFKRDTKKHPDIIMAKQEYSGDPYEVTG